MNGVLEKQVKDLKSAGRALALLSAEQKNNMLLQLAEDLRAAVSSILEANAKDLKGLSGKESSAFRDRLLLNEKRIEQMAESLQQVGALADPVGEIVESKILKNGLRLQRVRGPLGVLLMIFEARPNVITEAFSLAFKAGNRIVLRGGTESQHTSRVIYELMADACKKSGLPQMPFLGVLDFDRQIVAELLERNDIFDVVIPRGGEGLISFVQKTAKMPIIKNDRGLCHAYVDEDCDLEMAIQIVVNGKTQRPGVCNALETVLVHENIADRFLPALDQATRSVGLQWRADPHTMNWVRGSHVQMAKNVDWDTEHLDLILNCRVVSDLETALAHIEVHGSGHSEVIITKNQNRARRFQAQVDAAVVYWNASTRFTDGFEFGLGGELGISTQKLHVRGPVGLKELTIPRWIVEGHGQTRSG